MLMLVQVLLLAAFALDGVSSCDARSLIANHEGKRNCVYKDTMGIKTIGIGFNLETPGARAAIAKVGADYDSIVSGKTCLTDQPVALAHQRARARARRLQRVEAVPAAVGKVDAPSPRLQLLKAPSPKRPRPVSSQQWAVVKPTQAPAMASAML